MSQDQSRRSPVLRALNGVWPGCLPADAAGPGGIAIVALIVSALSLALLPLPWWLAFGTAAAAAAVAWRVVDRTPLWYAATIGLPVPQGIFLARLSMADLFILPSILRDAPRWLLGRLPTSSLVVPLLLLVAISAVATVVGYFRLGQWSQWGIVNKDVGLLLQVATLFAVSTRLRSFEDIRRVAQWFVIGVSLGNVGMLLGVVVRLFGIPNPLYQARLYGWMGQPTITGGLLLVAAMIELGSLASGPRAGERRALRWINLWLIGLSLALTVSRSAWLSVAGGAALLLLVLWVRRRRLAARPRLSHVVVTSLWLLVPCVFLGNVLSANLLAGRPLVSADRRAELKSELITKCLQRPEQDWCGPILKLAQEGNYRLAEDELPSSLMMPDVVMNARGLNDRIAIVRAGWEQYTRDWQSVLMGIGLGTFYATSEPSFGLPLIIHNTFAWYLFEFGPIGLAIVLWIWLRTARNIWTAMMQHEEAAALALGLTAAFGAFAVFCVFNEGFYQRQFWLVMVLADRLASLPKAKVDLAVRAAPAA